MKRKGRGKDSRMIYVIGDSHVSALSGRNAVQESFPVEIGEGVAGIRTIRLGAVLAYNLVSLETRNKGRQKLFNVLRLLPAGSRVVLLFGEIDCRAHLIKQAREQDRPLDTIVRNCVGRYVRVIREVKGLGFRVGILAPFASSWDTVDPSIEFPCFGTCVERNAVTRMFTEELNKKCERLGIPVISILDALTDRAGNTRRRFYMDGFHLSTRALPLLLPRLEAFRNGKR